MKISNPGEMSNPGDKFTAWLFANENAVHVVHNLNTRHLKITLTDYDGNPAENFPVVISTDHAITFPYGIPEDGTPYQVVIEHKRPDFGIRW